MPESEWTQVAAFSGQQGARYRLMYRPGDGDGVYVVEKRHTDLAGGESWSKDLVWSDEDVRWALSKCLHQSLQSREPHHA